MKRLEAGAEPSVNLSIAFDRCYQSLLFSSTSCLPTKSKHKVGNRAKMQTQQPQTPHQQQQNPQPSFCLLDNKISLPIMTQHLDAHARPPDALRLQYKHYQKASIHALDQDPDLFDAHRRNLNAYDDRNFHQREPEAIQNIYSRFLGEPLNTPPTSFQSARLYEHPDVPGRCRPSASTRSLFLSLR